jgi:hypothetical protein
MRTARRRLLGALASGTAILSLATVAAVSPAASNNSAAARPNPPCYARHGHLYCGNKAPTRILEAPLFRYEVPIQGWVDTPTVDWLDSNPSYFKCYVRGAEHSGGNNVWYYTRGDRMKADGYVPASEVFTPTRHDPFPGVNQC